MAPPHSRFAFALASAAAVACAATTTSAVSACETAAAASTLDTTAAACAAPRQATRDHLLLQTRSFTAANVSKAAPDGDGSQAMGYPGTGALKAEGLWCSVPMPPQDWNLKSCPLSGGASKITVKVLTYNLFWWNLFDQKGGSGRSAGKLIAQTGGSEQYDIMAFQECDDRHRVINDAKLEGLPGEWEAIDGGRAVAIAYLKSRWMLKAHGSEDVGEDHAHQHYGKRTAQWVRLQHTDGKVVFFVNHHGPLPVGWGGGCTGRAAAYNIMRVIAEHAHPDDAIVLVGDFNAEAHSSRIRELDTRFNRVFSGTEMGGVDHVFTNCAADAQGTNLGKGRGEFGSDHDALSVTFKF